MKQAKMRKSASVIGTGAKRAEKVIVSALV